MSSVIGFLSGSAMSGFAGYNNFRPSQLATAVLALVAFVTTYRATEPERVNGSAKPEGLSRIVKNSQFVSLAVSYFVTGLQFTGLTTLVGILMMQKFDFQPYQISIMFMAMTVMHFSLMVNLRWLTAKFGAVNNIIAAYCLAIIAHAIFMTDPAYHTSAICASLLLISSVVLPIGMTGGNLLAPSVADKYGKNARGATVGLLRTVFNVGQAIGPAYAVWAIAIDVDSVGGLSFLAPGFGFFALQIVAMLIAVSGLWIHWKLDKGTGQETYVPSSAKGDMKPPSGGWAERPCLDEDGSNKEATVVHWLYEDIL
jgi:nitrate/nitrite transporter NarK